MTLPIRPPVCAAALRRSRSRTASRSGPFAAGAPVPRDQHARERDMLELAQDS